jgi:GT2 family glycosyltransferase
MISVIIINYNSFALTSDCIRSVYRYTEGTPFELILVDNASVECDPHNFLIEFPNLVLVCSDQNLGFAGGNNLGIQQAKGDHILLLNSDTLLQEDSITRALDFLRRNPGTGVVGCRQVYPDGQSQAVARRFRTLQWELLDLFRFLLYLMPYDRRSSRMLGRYFRQDENTEADWVNGAFFLMPAAVLSQLPGQKLDERFFMYGEDVLWCHQIHQLGYRILYFAGTTLIHYSGGSTQLKKQLALRKTMIRHELEIASIRQGRGLAYRLFAVVFISKEYLRYAAKWLIFRLTGQLIR